MSSLPAVDFQAIFQTAPGLFLILAPDFTIVAVSDAYLKATMTEREGIVGRGLFDVFPDNPDDEKADGVSNLKASLNYVLTNRKAHEMAMQKYDIRRPDGVFEVRYWSPMNTPVFNSQNEIAYILHSATDVTGQQQTEAKLKKSESDYQLLVEGVKDYAIFMIDENGRVASWNDGAERIKGYKASEIIGQPIELFYTAEDIEQGIPRRNLQQARQIGHFEDEGWRLKKDGGLFWASIVITALKDEMGRFYGYSKIARDITETKNQKDQLELLSRQINQSNDAIYITDADRRIKTWNQGAQRLYGYTAEEALGKDVNLLLKTNLTNTEVDALLVEIESKEYWSGELRRKTKDGKDICVHSSATNLKDNAGRITGYIGVNFDITAQKMLREQVNHLADIVEQSSEAIISRGIDQRLISWNRGAEKLFGYSKAEAIGKKVSELNFTNLSQDAIDEISRVLIEKGTWSAEREYLHKNGSSFFGSVTANAVKNAQGELTSMVFIIQDISLRKQLEAQLKKYNSELEQEVKKRTEDVVRSEKKFRALIENGNDIISLMDDSFNLIYRSPAAYRVTGWTNEDMIGIKATTNIHPEDLPEAHVTAAEVLANPGKLIHCQFRMRHKSGHYFWVEGSFTNLLHDPNVNAIVFNFRDVSDRKRAEIDLMQSYEEKQALAKRMSIILNTLPANIALLDANGTIVEVNNSWRHFADENGFIGSHYCIGDNYLKIAGNASGKEKEDGQQVARGVKSVLNSKVQEFEYEYACDSPTLKRWFRMIVTPLQEKDFSGAVVMHIDISEIRRLEQERLKIKMEEQKKITKAMLIGQEKERNFLGQELHDNINQILAGTKLYLGMAGKKNNDLKKLIKYPMELLDTSIEEIRTLCHKMVTPLKDVQLEELVRELLRKTNRATNIKTRFTYAVPAGIISDELQLNIYRIIQELINNITRYADAHKVNIVIKEKEKAIVITVTDDGKGFDPGKKRSGVGISNITNRVASFNGKIDINSSEGNGCSTSIVIPY